MDRDIEVHDEEDRGHDSHVEVVELKSQGKDKSIVGLAHSKSAVDSSTKQTAPKASTHWTEKDAKDRLSE
jgi:hypothetical protein